MKLYIYINDQRIDSPLTNDETLIVAWGEAQELAEELGVSCKLINAETGTVIALWEP